MACENLLLVFPDKDLKSAGVKKPRNPRIQESEKSCSSLSDNQARTYSNGKFIAQVGHNDDHNTGIINNGWYTVKNAKAAPIAQTKCKYETAVNLFQHEKTRNIIRLFRLEESPDNGDIIEVIKKATGWDVTLPPPNKCGQQLITKKGLESMSAKQLKALYVRTLSCWHTSKKNTKRMIEDILRYRADAQKNLSPALKRKLEDTDIGALKKSIQGPVSPNRVLLEFYSKYYGLVDRIDRFGFGNRTVFPIKTI